MDSEPCGVILDWRLLSIISEIKKSKLYHHPPLRSMGDCRSRPILSLESEPSARNDLIKPQPRVPPRGRGPPARGVCETMDEEEEPGSQRSEARDGALARLRPAHGRLLRRGRGPVQRADSPARVSSHARPVRYR